MQSAQRGRIIRPSSINVTSALLHVARPLGLAPVKISRNVLAIRACSAHLHFTARHWVGRRGCETVCFPAADKSPPHRARRGTALAPSGREPSPRGHLTIKHRAAVVFRLRLRRCHRNSAGAGSFVTIGCVDCAATSSSRLCGCSYDFGHSQGGDVRCLGGKRDSS
jgi:hypothetical protein